MGTPLGYERRAIFLSAVCGQTYMQFDRPDGLFVIPQGYEVKHDIMAKSVTQAWEHFGFILESPQEIIIAFRGTSTTANWVSDMIASQKKFKYIKESCLTHRGFTAVYSSARDGILSALERLSSEKHLFVTGHSLGAALATLCAVDVAANTAFSAPSLYTFGSPRVGDPAFAGIFAKYVPSSCRFANLFDVVTLAPPSIYKLPKRETTYYYSHVRTLYSLSFLNGAFGPNHVIGSYFAELAKLDPKYALALAAANPGFCPVPEAEGAAAPEKSVAE